MAPARDWYSQVLSFVSLLLLATTSNLLTCYTGRGQTLDASQLHTDVAKTIHVRFKNNNVSGAEVKTVANVA